MESWSYVSGGNGTVSDGSVSAHGVSKSSENGLMGSELKSPSPWNYGGSIVCSSQEVVVNQEFLDLGSSDLIGKSVGIDSIGDVLALGGEISTFDEEESSSKFSSVESNCRDSSLIDLKLGGLSNDHRDCAKNVTSFGAKTRNLASSEALMPAKRARGGGGSSSQTSFCQVHGCRKDLSASKDYHKRHKVCEIHSKTPKVIVNGIEQRFCQQCSRFHLLAEFDDVKRSCRKRLAGHNERRRKPHVRIHDSRSGKLFPSFNATRFPGTALSASSFVCQDTHPSSLLNSSRTVKAEDGADLSAYLSSSPFANVLVPPKTFFGSHDSGKLCPSVLDDGNSCITRSKINESRSYIQDISDSDFVSCSVFHNEDTTVLDSSSTIQGLSESHSGRALSLLSPESQNSTNHSAGVPTALPLITSGSPGLYPVTPERLLGVGSLMNSSEEKFDLLLISGTDGIVQGSEYMNNKSRFSCEDCPTINLLQLSSQLQLVEQQRQSLLVKQENHAFSQL